MKKVLLAALFMLAVGTVGCGAKSDTNVSIIGGADGPTSVFVASKSEDGENTDDLGISIPGTWQTASIGYMDGDDMQPEYYVQFTETEINYGHMKDDAFVLDHSDKISEIEKNSDGEYKVKAESANGVQYTYQTAEGDTDVLEYYGTWNEDDFPEMYSGGASLSKCE
ncbi:MAG: sodium ion-translocating decarboxylase subunit beta [Butyrivibrio sp.]|nr:sodium ion-translocating decarboxylase subunit beta [Butyrivibrio sp.]